MPERRPPLLDLEFVLIKSRLGDGTEGCLAMAQDGTIRFVEQRPIDKETSIGFGYKCEWNLAGPLSADGKYVVIDKNGSLVVSDKPNRRFNLLYIYTGERGPNRKIKLVLRDTERKVDYTLKIEEKVEIVSAKDNPDSSRTHSVIAVEGHGGEDFQFSGFSK